MTTLRSIVERLRQDAQTRLRHGFREARVRRPALAAYDDIATVLAAMAEDGLASYPEREALSRAMLDEYRAGGGSVWASALVVAYYPMLSHLRNRLVCTSLPRDELDQMVITGFLSAVNEIPPHELLDRLPMRLRQRTERHVFAYLRKEREHYCPAAEREDVASLGAERSGQRQLAEANEQLLDLSLLLDRAQAQGVSTNSLEVVEATVLRRELLRTYVERVGPGNAAARERAYQRLKRQRSRAIKRLRALLSVSPVPAASGF